MNVRKFSVKPKVDSRNLSSTKVYPVLYICPGETFDIFVVEGDNGVAENVRYFDATIEDVEL